MSKKLLTIREKMAKINVMLERIKIAQQQWEDETFPPSIPVLEESNVINMRDKLHLRRKK